MTDRHNIAAVPDGAPLPAPSDVTAGDLGRVIAALGALAPELTAPVVTEELRLRQYERAANLAQWIATAAEDLADGLRGHMQRSGGDR